jgi:hypothetical protein
MYLQRLRSVGTGRNWMCGSCGDQEVRPYPFFWKRQLVQDRFLRTAGGGVAQASLTDRSKDDIPGSCRSSPMQRAGYVARGCLGRGSIGLVEK